MTSPVVIHHDSAGGTSCKASGIIPAAGHRPRMIDCLGEVWAPPQLPGPCATANITPRDAGCLPLGPLAREDGEFNIDSGGNHLA